MPARKPLALHTRHATKAEKAARVASEEALAPERGLPMAAPARLRGHPVAGEAWRRLMRLYAELEADIVTRLDQDLLIDYCMLMEQVAEIDTMRSTAYQVWLQLAKKHKELMEAGQADEAVIYAIKVVDAFTAVTKLDARADQKRKTLHQWRQSLYLTPRSRAGVAPAKKEEEIPPDDMELLLGEVTDYVNGGQ